MPGPASFVDGIRRMLFDGANCVVYLPEHAPEGLKGAIRKSIEDKGISWASLPCDRERDLAVKPDEWLVKYFGGKFDRKSLDWIHQLNGMDSTFKPGVYCIDDEGLDGARWAQWKKTLSDYSRVCTSKAPRARPVFLCLMHPQCEDPIYDVSAYPGQMPGRGVQDDVGLVCRSYRGVVTQRDMTLYAYLRTSVAATQEASLDQDIRANIAARIAAFDPEVCDGLLDQEGLLGVIDPTAVLKGIAAERGWTLENAPSWRDGSADVRQHGELVVHSALAVLQRPANGVIRERLWKAQVSVLMPFLEEQKNLFLGAYHSQIHGKDGDALEIKDVISALAGNGLARWDREYLDLLRHTRNMVAHLEPLSPGDFRRLRRLQEESSVADG